LLSIFLTHSLSLFSPIFGYLLVTSQKQKEVESVVRRGELLLLYVGGMPRWVGKNDIEIGRQLESEQRTINEENIRMSEPNNRFALFLFSLSLARFSPKDIFYVLCCIIAL
jgi:hypothetical protein